MRGQGLRPREAARAEACNRFREGVGERSHRRRPCGEQRCGDAQNLRRVEFSTIQENEALRRDQCLRIASGFLSHFDKSVYSDVERFTQKHSIPSWFWATSTYG